MPLLLLALMRSFWRLRGDRGFQILAGFAVLMIASATVFYSFVEGLRPVDAFYLSATTITTVGYGDFAPKTDYGKIFTAVYVLAGVGIFTAFLTLVAGQLRADATNRHARRRPARSPHGKSPVRRPVRKAACTRRRV